FTQFWTAQGSSSARLAGHDVFFTVGENIGSPDCPIPTCGIAWKTIRPPVALDHWPVISRGVLEKFTTVASWRGAVGPVEFGGMSFGVKVHEFRKFIEQPQRLAEREALAHSAAFEIALDIHPADKKDLDALQSHGWRVVDPRTVAADPGGFQ